MWVFERWVMSLGIQKMSEKYMHVMNEREGKSGWMWWTNPECRAFTCRAVELIYVLLYRGRYKPPPTAWASHHIASRCRQALWANDHALSIPPLWWVDLVVVAAVWWMLEFGWHIMGSSTEVWGQDAVSWLGGIIQKIPIFAVCNAPQGHIKWPYRSSIIRCMNEDTKTKSSYLISHLYLSRRWG